MPWHAADRPDESREFVSLDALRGIAALSVAICHGRFLAGDQPTSFFSEGYLAVDFFFALSGFILAHAYGKRLTDGMSIRRFMALRLIRLYPFYLLALLVSLALAAAQGFRSPLGTALTPADVAYALFLIPNLDAHRPLYPLNIPDLLYPMNIPAWSLLFELAANFLLALCWRGLTTPRLIVLVALAAAGLTLAATFRWLGFGTLDNVFAAGATWPSSGGGAARVLFSFFAGVLIHRWRQRRVRPRNIRRHGVATLVVGVVLLAILAAVPPRSAQLPYDLAATLVVFPALLFVAASIAPPPGIVAIACAWLGRVSYGVYVIQQAYYTIVMALTSAYTGRFFSGLDPGAVVASLLLLPVLATVADTYVDHPVRRWLTRRPFTRGSSRRPRGSAAPKASADALPGRAPPGSAGTSAPPSAG